MNTAFLLAIIKYRRDADLKNAVDTVQLNVRHEIICFTVINPASMTPENHVRYSRKFCVCLSFMTHCEAFL